MIVRYSVLTRALIIILNACQRLRLPCGQFPDSAALCCCCKSLAPFNIHVTSCLCIWDVCEAFWMMLAAAASEHVRASGAHPAMGQPCMCGGIAL